MVVELRRIPSQLRNVRKLSGHIEFVRLYGGMRGLSSDLFHPSDPNYVTVCAHILGPIGTLHLLQTQICASSTPVYNMSLEYHFREQLFRVSILTTVLKKLNLSVTLYTGVQLGQMWIRSK